jgi:hypothetical protein
VTLVEQEGKTIPEHMGSLEFSRVRVAKSLVFWLVFCRKLFVRCIVCPSIYG